MPIQDNYKAPSRLIAESRKLGWINEAIEQGTSFIRSSRAAVDMKLAVDIISGDSDEKIPKGRSTLQFNKVKRMIREIVAVSSQLRAVEGFRTDNNELEKSAYVLNKLWTGWFDNTFVDRSIRQAKQWAAATGTGWLSPVWKNDYWVTGRGDIGLEAYGAGQVLPVQMPQNGDIQNAYAVTIHSEMPLAMAHALFPSYQDKITADRTQPGFFKKMTDRFLKSQSPVLRLQEKKGKAYPFPVCDIYYTYIMDLSINDTGQTVAMGDPGTSWYYEVPSFGTDIPVGKSASGAPTYRKAGVQDCMLYPLRRLMISFSNSVVYDGTSKWWHGKYPLVKFQCDDWPWEPLGFPLTKDVIGLQASIVRLMRTIEENAVVRMDPPLQYGEGVAKSTMESIDLRAPGQRLQNPDMSTGAGDIKAILDPRYYDVPQWINQFLDGMENKMEYLAALPDMTALAKAAQIPSSDTVEKLLEISGPITNDIIRSDERSLVDLARLWMPLCFQFYTNFRTIQILGTDGKTEEQFDFDPGSLVPSHLPNEDPERPTQFTYLERAKLHMNNYFYQITKGSAFQQTNMSRKLLYAQIQKLGMPLDWWTLAEVFEIPNFGNPPKGTTTVIERWVAQQFLTAEIGKEMQAMIQPGIVSTPEQAAEQAKKMVEKFMGSAGQGRPPSFSAPPRLVQKDGGTRSTITTS